MTANFPLFNFTLQKKARVQAILLAIVCAFSMTVSSCNTAWLPVVTGYINTFLPIAAQIAQLVLMFNPGAIPADESAKIRGYLDEVQADATKLQGFANDYAKISANDPARAGKLKDINDVIATINLNLTNILPILHIQNAALQEKIKAGIGLLLLAIQQIVAHIPGAAGVTSVTSAEAQEAIGHTKAALHKNRTAASAPLTLKNGNDLKRTWNALMLAPSGDAQVDQKTATLVLK